ncbi:MAG: hypothetical protein K2P95_08330, partial [Hyphomonadaceae bacterium]|nr:hypothetical protein [Hyphomonadaceae bacterium]
AAAVLRPKMRGFKNFGHFQQKCCCGFASENARIQEFWAFSAKVLLRFGGTSIHRIDVCSASLRPKMRGFKFPEHRTQCNPARFAEFLIRPGCRTLPCGASRGALIRPPRSAMDGAARV